MWKSHPINSNYQANENGEIKSLNYKGKQIEKIIKQTKTPSGYLIVSINGKSMHSHRFIWECFNGIIENGMTIDHINTCRSDNRIDNLRKCSYTENNRNELTLNHIRESAAKFKGKKVLKLDKNTNEILGWYPSISEAARKNGISSKNYIKWVCEGKNGYYTSGGFKWKYTNDCYCCKWGKWWITENENEICDMNETVSDNFENDNSVILWKCKCSHKKHDFMFLPAKSKLDILTRLQNRKKTETDNNTINKINYAIKHSELWHECGNIGFIEY